MGKEWMVFEELKEVNHDQNFMCKGTMVPD